MKKFHFFRLVDNVERVGLEDKELMNETEKRKFVEKDATGGKSFIESSPTIKKSEQKVTFASDEK